MCFPVQTAGRSVALLQQVEAVVIRDSTSPLADAWPEFPRPAKSRSHCVRCSAIVGPIRHQRNPAPEAACSIGILWPSGASPRKHPGGRPAKVSRLYAPVTYAWLLGEPLKRLSGEAQGA